MYVTNTASSLAKSSSNCNKILNRLDTLLDAVGQTILIADNQISVSEDDHSFTPQSQNPSVTASSLLAVVLTSLAGIAGGVPWALTTVAVPQQVAGTTITARVGITQRR